MISTEGGRSSVYQNGSTTMMRASCGAVFRRPKSSVICDLMASGLRS
jgi:hypothetical protein